MRKIIVALFLANIMMFICTLNALPEEKWSSLLQTVVKAGEYLQKGQFEKVVSTLEDKLPKSLNDLPLIVVPLLKRELGIISPLERAAYNSRNCVA